MKYNKVRKEIRRVPCMDCGAEANNPCVNKTSGVPIAGTHKSRNNKAEDEGLVFKNSFDQLFLNQNTAEGGTAKP